MGTRALIMPHDVVLAVRVKRASTSGFRERLEAASDERPMPEPVVTRFAPSPTGLLHLGHAYAAKVAHDLARGTEGGRFLLRFEDIDHTRVRPEYYAAIEEDLRWLGLAWDGPALRQSERGEAYAAALA